MYLSRRQQEGLGAILVFSDILLPFLSYCYFSFFFLLRLPFSIFVFLFPYTFILIIFFLIFFLHLGRPIHVFIVSFSSSRFFFAFSPSPPILSSTVFSSFSLSIPSFILHPPSSSSSCFFVVVILVYIWPFFNFPISFKSDEGGDGGGECDVSGHVGPWRIHKNLKLEKRSTLSPSAATETTSPTTPVPKLYTVSPHCQTPVC